MPPTLQPLPLPIPSVLPSRSSRKSPNAGRALNVRLEGQLIVNEIALALHGALDGLGIAYLLEDYVHADIEAGRLARVVESWCPPSPAITSITRAAVINRPPSRFWWRRCATALSASLAAASLISAHRLTVTDGVL